MDYMSIIKEVAARNGVSADEVRTEIECALGQAFHSQNQEECGVWAEIAPNGVQPDPEDVIFRLAVKVMLEGAGTVRLAQAALAG